jgi:gliding motility-associated-like protein
LKRSILLTFVLISFYAVQLYAANRYWVGGSGSWSDNKHWAEQSGGRGGASLPGSADDVYFDLRSFSSNGQAVDLDGQGYCRSFSWKTAPYNASFTGSLEDELHISGSFILSSSVGFKYEGKLIFSSAETTNKILSAGKTLNSPVHFQGQGAWTLSDAFSSKADIHFEGGTLNTNGKNLTCNSFYSTGTAKRSLILGSSRLDIAGKWDLSQAQNLILSAGSSEIVISNASLDNFKPGKGLTYGTLRTGSPGVSPQSHTVTTTVVPNPCNGDCIATATAVVSGGTGPFSYVWSDAASQTTQTAVGLCAGTYLVVVTDISSGDQVPAFATIVDPPPLVIFFSNTPATCNTLCNGTSSSTVAGGTPGYTYSWMPGGYSTSSVTGLCAGTYTLTINDANSCVRTQTTTITQPTPIVSNGTFSNVTCFNACDGTASVNPSGGTPPYNVTWSPGNIPGNSLTNLCPGTYTATIKDANNCQVTYVATITQPPVLSATVSKTNASCGGVCDGTAAVAASGGTPNYSYSWTPGGQTTSSVSGLCAGSYTVAVTDVNGCTLNRTVVITEPAILTTSPTGVNISCFSLCNGTAAANAAGGTPGYTYLWSPGNMTTPTVSNLCQGTYTVNVTDANGCTATNNVSIVEPSLLVANASGNNVSCFAACNGSVTAAPTGGTSPYTYNWMPGSVTTQTINNLCAGSYTVTVTDANGCTANQVVTITQPPQLLANATKTNATCNGACNGTATANPSGGTPAYSYSWMPGNLTTQTITGLCAGSYTVTVTDAMGCTVNQTITITQPNPLSVGLNATPLTCNNTCSSIISTNISGGTAAYTYSWGAGQTTSSISGQCAGSYSVTVTDANNCTATASTTVNQPTALTVITSSNNASCNNSCNGSAAGIAGGGTPPYSYIWTPGNFTTSSVNNLCAGTYTLTVTDANACQGTSVVNITEPSILQANVSSTDVTCNSACNGTATSSPTGGTGPYSYSWAPGGSSAQSLTNLCAGSYTVTVTDLNGCTSVQSVLITQPTPLSPVISSTTSSCNICNGSASSTVTGGVGPYQYSWSTTPTAQTTTTATGLCPGPYTITVTDANGCTATATGTVTQTVNIIITSSSSSLSCSGACDGIATANANGGASPYSFLWSPTNPIQVTQTATGLCAGTYSVTATDANGCFNTATVTFTNPPVLTATLSGTNTSCNAACDGTATATPAGGTGAYTYNWMPGGQTTQTATALCSGTYTVTVKDVNNCTYVDSVTITQSPSITDNPTVTDANCNQSDGAITLAPAGGVAPYTFLWSTGATTQNLTLVPAGSYTVTITDMGGCSSVFMINVNNLNGPALTNTSTNATCSGSCDGTALVAATGGTGTYTYLWSPGGQTTPSVSNLCAGTSNVQVTDGVGCITFGSVTITEPAPVVPHATISNVTCGGACNGSISLVPTGGAGTYTYSWLPGGQNTATVTGLCAGTYTVTISDPNGCDTTAIFNITQPQVLSVTMASNNVTCNGACNGTATATPAGGTGPFGYAWSPNGGVLQTVVNLCPAAYSVVITDANGCTANNTVTITQPAPLTSSLTSSNVTCNSSCNGSATLTASGGTPAYAYSWSPGSMTTATVNSLCSGSYNVTVTDGNGCTSSQSVNITQPTLLVAGATSTNATCNGICNGAATASPTGGTGPYTFAWAPGGQVTQSVNGLCAGSYTLTVTDANGCTASQVITITQPAILLANASSTSPLCSGDCNGTVTASPLGGTAPFAYLWGAGQTTQTVSSICAGSYNVTVTDVNGCATTATVAVTNPAAINISVSMAPANCGTNNGTITVTPVTGSGPYTYVWQPPVAAGNSASGLAANIYTVTVTDANGCDSTFAIPLSNTGGPSGATNATINTTCTGGCNGVSSVAPVGGTTPYTYQWYDAAGNTIGVTNDTASALCAGIYIIGITDANGCIFFTQDTVGQPAPIALNGSVTQTSCSGICNGAITLSPTGGTGTYTFLWQPGGATTATISNICGGTYTVTVTDQAGCSKIDSFQVTPSMVLSANVSTTGILCSSVCSGTASISVVTGTAPYNFQWNDPFGQTASTASNLCAGTYSVTLTDALGCNITLPATINSTSPISANPTVTNANCGACDGQATLAPTGGTSPFTYSWSTGSSTNSAAGLCAGLYFVSITDANGCSASFQVPVSNNNAPSFTASVTNVSCFGVCDGTASLNVTGGAGPYTYLWSTGGQTTSSVSGLCAGTYFAQVQDANGCSIVDSVVIGTPTQIQDNHTVINASCGSSNGSITLNPTGGNGPYSYSWTPPVSATNAASGLAAGLYDVAITDASGCTINVSVPVSNPGGPGIAVTSTNISCNGAADGTATADTTGGSIGPFTYLWSNGQSTAAITGLSSGTYIVQVTDGAGCTSSAQVTITEPQPLTFSIPAVVNESCASSCNGSATAIASGGTLPYQFLWSNGATTATASGLCSGSYTLTVTDANGCTITNSTTITGPIALNISSTVTDATCSMQNDGAIDITVTGGTAPYTYQWSGGSTANTEDIASLFPGTYSVLVTDANGCQATASVTVNAVITVIADAGNDSTFCEGGSFVLDGSGSTTATSYQWLELPGNTVVGTTVTATVNPSLGSTSYVLIASNGVCTDADTITVTSNPLPVADAGQDGTILIFNTTTIGGSPTGTPGSIFSWSPGASLNDSVAANPVASPTVTTTYTVTVINASGCISTDSVTITVLPQIVFPNGISPNGDGSNDEWIIDNIDQFPSCVVEVYNRWGELLFHSVGYHERWDGKYKGQDLPVGTYYYIINLNDPLYPDAFTGPITILR